jgi:hypothetical protein
LLGRKDVIDTIGTASERSGQYTRIVNIGENIGTIKPSIPNLGGKPTTWITVITDIKGNLITAYGPIDRRRKNVKKSQIIWRACKEIFKTSDNDNLVRLLESVLGIIKKIIVILKNVQI